MLLSASGKESVKDTRFVDLMEKVPGAYSSAHTAYLFRDTAFCGCKYKFKYRSKIMSRLQVVFFIAAVFLISWAGSAGQVVLKMDDSWKLMALSGHAGVAVVSDAIELTNTGAKPFAAVSR